MFIDGERVVEADVEGLERPLVGLTLLEAAAVGGDALALDALADKGRGLFQAEGIEEPTWAASADLRYAGQSYELTVPLSQPLGEGWRGALAELRRVLTPGGELMVSVPNLAHLQSRVHFLFLGRLIRTASEFKHPGDRPIGEYIRLAERAGLVLIGRRGIFPTVPVLTRLIRRHPRALLPLHRWLTRLLPIPGWCFLNLLTFRKP